MWTCRPCHPMGSWPPGRPAMMSTEQSSSSLGLHKRVTCASGARRTEQARQPERASGRAQADKGSKAGSLPPANPCSRHAIPAHLVHAGGGHKAHGLAPGHHGCHLRLLAATGLHGRRGEAVREVAVQVQVLAAAREQKGVDRSDKGVGSCEPDCVRMQGEAVWEGLGS